MVSEDLGDFDQLVGAPSLELARDPQVQLSAPRRQHAVVKRVAKQRVLEGELLRGVIVAQEIRRLRGCKVGHEIARGSHERGQQIEIEASSDHRSNLKDPAIVVGEAADAGGQQQLDARRQHGRRLADVELQRSVADLEHVALDEEAHELLGE